jgi:hypothetical protein
MAKMTRAEKRRRKIAKMMEIKLDGIPTSGWQKVSYEELCQYHKYELEARSRTQPNYYGYSLADHVLNRKAQELQRSIDRAILEELNGELSRPS